MMRHPGQRSVPARPRPSRRQTISKGLDSLIVIASVSCSRGQIKNFVYFLFILTMDGDEKKEMTVHNGGLLLRPITDAGDHKASVRKSSARMAKIHRQSLRELAD